MATTSSGATVDRWVENAAPDLRTRRRLDLRELWAYRELVWFFAARDVKVRYKQTALGAVWAVVQPVAGSIVFTVVFRRLARVPSDGVPYLVFAFAGMAAWSYISASLNAATMSLVGNVSLVTKVWFPRIAAPVAAVLPGLVDLGISLVLLAVLMAVTGVVPSLALVFLPLCVAGFVVLALGFGLALATYNVEYRDVKNVIGLLIQLWLFASPVAYPSSLVKGAWRYLYAVNPMAGLLDLFRWSTLGTPAPGLPLLVSLASMAAISAFGLRSFLKAERRFADVI
ncbi:ABC transporter permease [soil metagenome]|nr:ABC transporter permease [Acidimicrobiia bacterium]